MTRHRYRGSCNPAIPPSTTTLPSTRGACLIYVFYGEDDFSSSKAITPLVEAVGPEDMRDSNITVIDGGRFSVDNFGAAAMVVPFLAERRLVIVRGLLATAETQRAGRRGRRTKANDDSRITGLSKLLPDLPSSTDVIFVDGKIGTDNPILAEIKALGPDLVKQCEYPPMRRDSISEWIRVHTAAKGTSIEPQAVAELAEILGPDLWALDSAIEKLAIYVGNRSITLADVHGLVTGNRESNVFELVDAIMEKRSTNAFNVNERLLNSGATGPYLLSMITRQVRMVAIAQDLASRKVPSNEWGQHIGTSSDFVIRKTSEQARRFSDQAVRDLYRLLLETDLAMKTSDTTEEMALTQLLAGANAIEATPRPNGRSH